MSRQGLNRHTHFFSCSSTAGFENVLFLLSSVLLNQRIWTMTGDTFSCSQVQDDLRFIDFTSDREAYVHFLCVCSFYESHICIFERLSKDPI